MGLLPRGELFGVVNLDGGAVPLPREGIVLSRALGEILGVAAGDAIQLEVLEEQRPVRRVTVAGLVNDFAGLTGYMDFDAANRLMGQEGVMSGAFVTADRPRTGRMYRALKLTPRVASVSVRAAALQSFHETMARTLLRMRAFNVAFAVVIAFGVVYNTARISLSERSRELATLRVIGFTRGEISLIQLGELAVLTLVGIPGGLLLGYGLAALTHAAYDTELFRLPLAVDRSTYAFSAAVILTASVFSGLVVRRMLDRLNLIAVLKTRE
jgi:putative ABC transport system permease protein